MIVLSAARVEPPNCFRDCWLSLVPLSIDIDVVHVFTVDRHHLVHVMRIPALIETSKHLPNGPFFGGHDGLRPERSWCPNRCEIKHCGTTESQWLVHSGAPAFYAISTFACLLY